MEWLPQQIDTQMLEIITIYSLLLTLIARYLLGSEMFQTRLTVKSVAGTIPKAE